jgi:hypothetical protein
MIAEDVDDLREYYPASGRPLPGALSCLPLTWERVGVRAIGLR